MALYEGGVSFLSRMPEKTKLYKDLVMECLPEIEKEENLVTYNGRCVYLVQKRVLLVLPNQKCKILTFEFVKKANDVLKYFKLKCPISIPNNG